MNKIRILIKKFWEDQLSEEESNELDSLLKYGDTEFRSELEREFHQSVALKEGTKESRRERQWGKVVSIGHRSIWGAAAAVIVVLFIGMQLFNSKETGVVVKSDDHTMAEDRNNNNDIAEVENSSGIDLPIHLPDGSTVMLAPRSKVSYKRYFDAKNRDIQLTGKAVFKVAKDKNRPFSVLTGEYATTALGTEFEVNTFGKNKIVVKLFEGKIKVHAIRHVSNFETVYLTPGQSLSIDKERKPENILVKKPLKKEIGSNSENRLAQLSFDHESLKDVFDKLSSTYKVNIEYNAQDVEGLYFTGYLLESDTIKSILTLIANMNDLDITDTQGGFRIVKK